MQTLITVIFQQKSKEKLYDIKSGQKANFRFVKKTNKQTNKNEKPLFQFVNEIWLKLGY